MLNPKSGKSIFVGSKELGVYCRVVDPDKVGPDPDLTLEKTPDPYPNVAKTRVRVRLLLLLYGLGSDQTQGSGRIRIRNGLMNPIQFGWVRVRSPIR